MEFLDFLERYFEQVPIVVIVRQRKNFLVFFLSQLEPAAKTLKKNRSSEVS